MIAALIPQQEKPAEKKTMELFDFCAIFTGKDFKSNFRRR